MANQVLNLESFSTNNNLLTPNNALGSATGTFTTNVDNAAWDVIGEFPTPTEAQANGTHVFTARVRKDPGTNNPNFQMIVQDGAGNTLGDSGAVAITSETGEDVVVNVAGSALQAGSGGLAGVRVSLIGSQTGGGPSARSVPQLDYVSWSGDFTTPLSSPPVADAGTNQSVQHGDGTVNLDGTGSSDDVAIVTWAWVQTAGTDTVTLTNPDTSTPSFNCDALTPDTYTFQLTVTDGDTQSDSATVDVIVALSDVPVADAGPDQNVTPTSGGGSTDQQLPSSTWDADSQYQSFGPAMMNDGQAGGGWLTAQNTTTGSARRTFDTPVVIDAYLLTPTGSTITDAPKDWTIRGSNNGTDWDVLDTRAGVNDWSWDGGLGWTDTHYYEFENTTPYSIYEINVTANNGGTSFLRIGEWVLTGPEYVPAVVVPKNYNPSTGADKIFDGSDATEWRAGLSLGDIRIAAPAKKTVSSFKLKPTTADGHAPDQVTLYGSHDGETWVKLYEDLAVASWTALEWKTFTLGLVQAYRFYHVAFHGIGDIRITEMSIEWAATNWDPDVVGRWHINEGTGTLVADSSPNGYDGDTLGDGEWAGVGPSGGSGESWQPLTTNEAIQVADPVSAANNFGGIYDGRDSDGFGVVLWAKPNLGGTTYLLTKSSGAANGWELAKSSSEFPFFRPNNNSTYRAISSVAMGTSGTVWYCLIGVYDPILKQTRIYVDGVLRGTTDITALVNGTGIVANTEPVTIGGRTGGSGNNDVAIAEAMIINRVLTQAEIDTIVANPPETLEQTVGGGSTPTVVNLDGTGSTDDVGIVSYAWVQLSGTTVTLNDANTNAPYFDAPDVNEALVFQLTVTDADGQTDTDTVTINVGTVTPTVAIYVYNGTLEVSATITVFNGSSEDAATLEFAP